MTMTAPGRHASTPAPDPDLGYRPGPLGRLGVWVTDHARLTTVVWILLIVGLGAFAPRVESQLSGAGWQADGSESVAARQLAQDHFGGNASPRSRSSCTAPTARSPPAPGRRSWPRPRAMLEADPRIAGSHRATARCDVEPGRARPPSCWPGPAAGSQRDGPGGRRPQGTATGTSRPTRHPGQPDGSLTAVVGLQRGQPQRHAQVGDVLLAGHARDPRARLRSPGRRRTATHPDPGRAGRLRRIPGADQPVRPGLHLGDELRHDVRPRPGHRLRPVPRGALPGGPDGPPRVAATGHRRDHGHGGQGRAALRRHRADLPVRGDARALTVVPVDGRRDHARRRLRARRNPDPAPAGAVQARCPDQQAGAAVGAHRRAPVPEVRRLG